MDAPGPGHLDGPSLSSLQINNFLVTKIRHMQSKESQLKGDNHLSQSAGYAPANADIVNKGC